MNGDQDIPETECHNQKKDSDQSEYTRYVELLREYFEIKNDELKSKIKFNEIICAYHELKSRGVIGS